MTFLKRFKGESFKKTIEISHQDDLPIAEFGNLGVIVPQWCFDDVVVSVLIKKWKIFPPSPPPFSPKASSPLEPLHSEPLVSIIYFGKLLGTKEKKGPLNTHKEQQLENGMGIARESIQEKNMMLVGTMSNETRGKPSIDYFSQDTTGNVDILGVSTSTMDASISKLVRNNLDNKVSQVGYLSFENGKLVAVNLKNTNICVLDYPQHNNMHEDT